MVGFPIRVRSNSSSVWSHVCRHGVHISVVSRVVVATHGGHAQVGLATNDADVSSRTWWDDLATKAVHPRDGG